MARRSRLLLVVSIVLAVLAASGCSKVSTTEVPPPATDDTTLGPGDVLKINVYGEETLSGEHRVAQDGTISFPLIGRVEVTGLEPTEIADKLQHELKAREFLKDPHVSIYVLEYSSKRISVVGAVANPGTFPLEPGMTVVQAISKAGGFTSLADRNATVVTRKVNGNTVRYRVPVDRVTNGQADDIEVAASDIIFVPERMF